MVTRTIEGKEYTFGRITLGDGRQKLSNATGGDASFLFVALSLQAGGHTDATPEWMDANLPYLIDGKPSIVLLLEAAYEANGFKTKLEKPTPGEEQPPVAAAESTSSTSTEA